jgi:hypothetical protein
MKILFLFIIIIPIFTFSQNAKKFELKTPIELRGKVVDTEILLNPYYIHYFDSYILIHNDQTPDYHYDLLDIKTGRIISSFCKKGRGPGEVIFPKSVQIFPEKNEILVYDVNTKKVNFYDLNKVLEFNPENYLRSFRIDSAYAKRVIQLENGNYICPLIGDSKGYKYCSLDQEEKYIGSTTLLPDIGKEYPTLVSSNLFNYRAETNQSRNKIVMAYDHWDRIDVMTDVNTFNEIEINGPNHAIPEISVSGPNLSIKGDKSIYAYQSPCVGEESFFVLYSGKSIYDGKNRKRNSRNYEYMLNFDFNGNLLSTYHLQPALHLITVDWDRNVVYGINKNMEPILIKYSL